MSGFAFLVFILLVCSIVCIWIIAIQAAEIAAESAAAAPRPAFVLVRLPPPQQQIAVELPQEQLAQRFPGVPLALQQQQQQPPAASSSSGAPHLPVAPPPVHDPRCCEVCTASHQRNPFLPPLSPPPRAPQHRRSHTPSPPIPSEDALGPPSGSPVPLHPLVASIPLVAPAQQIATATRGASLPQQPHLSPRNDATEPVEVKDEPRLRRPPALCLDRRPDPSNFAQRNDLQGIQQ